MTRDELRDLIWHIAGITLTELKLDTIMAAVDCYAAAQLQGGRP